MDTTLLTVFREAARCGSLTAAALALGYTQSAVSRQMATLERELGAPLVERESRGIRLTDEGRCLLDHAEAVLDRVDRARRDVRAVTTLETGRLRLGAFATANVFLVPQAMAAFERRHPHVELSLQQDLTPALLRRLRDGDLDLCVVSSPANGATSGGAERGGVRTRRLMDDAWLVALPPGHRLARRRTIRLGDLTGERWITGSREVLGSYVESALPVSLDLDVRYVVPEWTAKLGLVAAGLGVALVPSLAVGGIRPDLLLRRMHPEDVPARRIGVAVRAGSRRSASVTAFVDDLVEAAGRLRRSLAAVAAPASVSRGAAGARPAGAPGRRPRATRREPGQEAAARA
ncbi:MAG: LysR family transcriptional regulator [Dermatophilaceae bacterium]